MHVPALSCPIFRSAPYLLLVCLGLSPYFLRSYMYGPYTDQVRAGYRAGAVKCFIFQVLRMIQSCQQVRKMNSKTKLESSTCKARERTGSLMKTNKKMYQVIF